MCRLLCKVFTNLKDSKIAAENYIHWKGVGFSDRNMLGFGSSLLVDSRSIFQASLGRRKHMRAPLTHRNVVLEEQLDLEIRPSSGFTDTEPNIRECDDSCTRIYESKHWTKASIIIYIWRCEGNDPNGEEERHDSA